MNTNNTIQVRRALASVFTLLNPVLADGEPGYETDTRKIKYGNGVTAWNSLAYAASAVDSVAGRTGAIVLSPSDVGLGNVSNVNPLARSNHTGTQTASTISDFNSAASAAAPVQRVNNQMGNITIDKNTIGLGNVPNTDATLRSNHTGTQLASTISDFNTAVSNSTSFSSYSSWSALTVPASIGWTAIAYGNNTLVMVSGTSDSTAAATSLDEGTSWTQRTLPSSIYWNTIAYGNGVFVTTGFPSIGTTNIAATSPDGITWTSRTMPASAVWRSVTYANGLFVAVTSGPSTYAATSPNGITWTLRTLPSAIAWMSVSYGNGLFVAIAQSATVAATSPDGITWTSRTLPVSANWMSITYGNGVFVAIAQNSSVAATSYDGITWTQRALPLSAGWWKIAYGNGVFVAIANGTSSNGAAATSSDGVTWTQRTLSASASWYAITYVNGSFVAVGGPSPAVGTRSVGGVANIKGLTTSLSDARNPLATSSSVAHGNSGSALTLSSTAAVQTCSLSANCTFTMPNATASNFILILTQTGSFTAAFTGVKWPGGVAPTITTGANKVDVIQFVSDGTNWYGRITQNY